MVNKDDFYLKDIELLKLLQPIMARKGIEADKYYIDDKLFYPDEIVDSIDTGEEPIFIPASHYGIPTWHKPSLEAALPDWVHEYISDLAFSCAPTYGKYLPLANFEEMSEKVSELVANIIGERGQAGLKSLAELIILLDKEGVE